VLVEKVPDTSPRGRESVVNVPGTGASKKLHEGEGSIGSIEIQDVQSRRQRKIAEPPIFICRPRSASAHLAFSPNSTSLRMASSTA
jgi:hypothetical protein